jgi:ABC-2 type transport system ATP-binding protein
MATVVAESLGKRFGELTAVDGVSFAVEAGEVFGILGPDGAGKTTLFRLLVTLLKPDAGRAEVAGVDVVTGWREVRRRVGYMPGRFSLYQDLSVAENLEFFAAVFGTTVAANRDLVEPVYQHLAPFADRRAGALSGGMKQKLALCCALIHRPSVLLLDEPTTGVDAVSRRELWEMLGTLSAQGITLVVSTPYMDEASRCHRVALMSGGRFLTVDRPEALAGRYGAPLFGVALGPHRRLPVLEALRRYPHARSVYVFGETIHVTDRRAGANEGELAAYLTSAGFGEAHVTPIEPGIEDVFMALASAEAPAHA